MGRPLRSQEVQHFTDTARRIASIIELVNVGTRDPHVSQPFLDYPSRGITAQDSYGDTNAG